jgi:cytochrome P450
MTRPLGSPLFSLNLLSTISLVALSLFLLALALKLVRKICYPSLLRGIPGPPSQSWFMGNLRQLFNAKGMPFHEMLVNEYGGVAKIHGFFGDQQLYVSDPRALHSIIVKDQDAFDETSVFIETNKVIFGPGLVATTGQQHKRQRKIVIPVFSVPHLKRLTPIFYSVAERLADVIDSESDKNSGSIIDMADWMARVALETVGQTILGYSFDPLDSPHNNRYTSAIKELIPTLFKLSLVRQFAPFLSQLGSPSFRRKLVDLTPVSSVQAVKNMSDVMYATAKELLRQKQNEVSLGIVQDERSIIGALLKANEKASAEDKMTEDELIGQITVLIFGAQDTTASSLTRLLHMLSTHTNVQDQLRDEVSEALASTGDGRLDYDVVMSLPLLDAVLKETLRLYVYPSFDHEDLVVLPLYHRLVTHRFRLSEERQRFSVYHAIAFPN